MGNSGCEYAKELNDVEKRQNRNEIFQGKFYLIFKLNSSVKDNIFVGTRGEVCRIWVAQVGMVMGVRNFAGDVLVWLAVGVGWIDETS